MDVRAGPVARDAILNLLGDNVIALDLIVELLVEKGVITQAEWDAAHEARYVAPTAVGPIKTARLHLDPEDNEALDRFFAYAPSSAALAQILTSRVVLSCGAARAQPRCLLVREELGHVLAIGRCPGTAAELQLSNSSPRTVDRSPQ